MLILTGVMVPSAGSLLATLSFLSPALTALAGDAAPLADPLLLLREMEPGVDDASALLLRTRGLLVLLLDSRGFGELMGARREKESEKHETSDAGDKEEQEARTMEQRHGEEEQQQTQPTLQGTVGGERGCSGDGHHCDLGTVGPDF